MFLKIICIITAFCLGQANSLKIEINKGLVKPDPIAIVDFYDEEGHDSQIGSSISSIIRDDLLLSGLFEPLPETAFVESKEDLCQKGINIKNWRILDLRFLVHGKISQNSNNFSINFELVDIVTGDKMLTLKVDGKESQLRKAAHIIADFIYERITNEKGYFNTNIIYVETANKVSSKRKTRLVKIDQDGFNPKPLTDGDELVVTPRYSPDGKKIAYISYSDKEKDVLGKSAHIYVMDLETGSKKLMIHKHLMKLLIKKNRGNPVQMTYAPRFSPDGKRAVLAIIIDGKSAIYTFELATNELRQLTDHSCIDTSPCFSSDGKKIVFTSNREGREAIFIMNLDGSEQTRITKGEGKYSQPSWSPRGDLIAFSKQTAGEFYIGLIKPDGSGERLILNGYLVEAPCWSSNGRYLACSMEPGPGKKSCLAVVDITGYHVRKIETRKDGTYPAWSPTIEVRTR
jgi:TolB protein